MGDISGVRPGGERGAAEVMVRSKSAEGMNRDSVIFLRIYQGLLCECEVSMVVPFVDDLWS